MGRGLRPALGRIPVLAAHGLHHAVGILHGGSGDGDGAGYARRRQFAKALLMTLVEAGVAAFTLLFAMQYVPKFGTLGTVQAEQVFSAAGRSW